MDGASPPLLRDPVERLLQWNGRRPPARMLVGLVGLPGAGKSTIAALWEHDVNARLGARAMQVLGMDGFHWSREALAGFPDPAAALARRGAPWTFDGAGLAQRLRQLRTSGGVVPWPGFEHGVGDPVAAALQVDPGACVVLVEGLYLLHHGHGWQLDGLFDECWYLDVDLDTAMERVAARHQSAWSLTREQALARVAANDRLNAQFVLDSRPRAHWRVR